MKPISLLIYKISFFFFFSLSVAPHPCIQFIFVLAKGLCSYFRSLPKCLCSQISSTSTSPITQTRSLLNTYGVCVCLSLSLHYYHCFVNFSSMVTFDHLWVGLFLALLDLVLVLFLRWIRMLVWVVFSLGCSALFFVSGFFVPCFSSTCSDQFWEDCIGNVSTWICLIWLWCFSSCFGFCVFVFLVCLSYKWIAVYIFCCDFVFFWWILSVSRRWYTGMD